MLTVPGKLFETSTKLSTANSGQPSSGHEVMEVTITIFQSTVDDISLAARAQVEEEGGEVEEIAAAGLRLNFSCPTIGDSLDIILSRTQQIDLVGKYTDTR